MFLKVQSGLNCELSGPEHRTVLEGKWLGKRNLVFLSVRVFVFLHFQMISDSVVSITWQAVLLAMSFYTYVSIWWKGFQIHKKLSPYKSSRGFFFSHFSFNMCFKWLNKCIWKVKNKMYLCKLFLPNEKRAGVNSWLTENCKTSYFSSVGVKELPITLCEASSWRAVAASCTPA